MLEGSPRASRSGRGRHIFLISRLRIVTGTRASLELSFTSQVGRRDERRSMAPASAFVSFSPSRIVSLRFGAMRRVIASP